MLQSKKREIKVTSMIMPGEKGFDLGPRVLDFYTVDKRE
jgi:hypothetical protein